MANLFFQSEITTTVEVLDDDVFIFQYEDNSCKTQTRFVRLSKRQFEEMFNRSKTLFEPE